METLIHDIEEIHEDIQRLENRNKSLDILERIKKKYPQHIMIECEYQNYREKFSDAYFMLSIYNFGDSIVEYMIEEKGNLDIIFGSLFCAFFMKNALRNNIKYNQINIEYE